MAKTFRSGEVDQGWLPPPSLNEFAPPDHLAHFVRDTVREARSPPRSWLGWPAPAMATQTPQAGDR